MERRQLWSVPPAWKGATVYILGSGPSIAEVDLALLTGQLVIAVNNAWELWRTANVLYFCDAAWWTQKKPKAQRYSFYPSNRDAVLRAFPGSVVSVAESINEPGVRSLAYDRHIALSEDPQTLAHGGNSGYQAINLAVLFGATRIVLVGFDMRVDGARTHWHDGHRRQGQTQEEYVEAVSHRMSANFIQAFGALVEPLDRLGVEVVHATPTALPYWPVKPLREIVGRSAMWAVSSESR